MASDASELVDDAIDAYKNGDKEGAVRLLTEALRRDPRNETAWLYMGASLDDPQKRREAFQRVLQINPANDKAKAALERLNAGRQTGTTSQVGKTSTGSSAKTSTGTNASAESLKKAQQQAQKFASTAYTEGFAVPVKIDGAPEKVNGPYIREHGQTRVKQGFGFFMNRDFENYDVDTQNPTLWDSVFIIGLGAFALGLAELVGRFFGFFLILFGHHPNPFGAFIEIFTAPVLVMAAAGAGFAAAIYAARFFLKQQYQVDAPIPQLGMSFALTMLPLMLIQAGFNLVAALLGAIFGTIAILIGLVLYFYAWYLLKDVFARAYGSDNDRNMYVAAIVVGVYLIVFGLIRGILRV